MIEPCQKDIMCIGGPLHLQVQCWDSIRQRDLVVVEPEQVDVFCLRPTSVKYERVRSLAERLLTLPWNPGKTIDAVKISIPPPDIPVKRRRYLVRLFANDGRRCYFYVYESIKESEAFELIEDSRKASVFLRGYGTPHPMRG